MKLSPKSPTLSDHDVRAIVRLLGEVCAQRGRVDQIRVLMNGICEIVKADCWVWGASVRLQPDALPTWVLLEQGGFDEERFAKFLRAQEHPDLAVLTAPFAKDLLRLKTHLTRMRQQTDPEDRFRQSNAYSLWEEADISPGILSCRPVSDSFTSACSVYRRMNAPLFDERECRIAHILLTEVPWLHSPLEEETDESQFPLLSPRQHTIFNLLILGYTRLEIASHLELSIHTVNQYVKEVYRHFGAHSQAELTARFRRGDRGDIMD